MMRPKPFFMLAFFFALGVCGWGQETPPEDDIDSIFSGNGDDQPPDTQKPEGGNQNPLEGLFTQSNISVKANFFLLAGYSPGLNYAPWDAAYLSSIDYQDMALLKMQTGLTFDFRISPEFRVSSKIGCYYPQVGTNAVGFTLQLNELFFDYILANTLFFRIGRQNLNWGISRNFPFTNLPARIPIGRTSVGADSYAVKLNLPIGIGGFEVIAFARDCYFSVPTSPAADEIGAGGTFNLALDIFDLNVGTYYQKDLHLRVFGSLKTTLFKKLELYAEGLFAADLDYAYDPLDNQMDFSADAGFYISFLDDCLELNGEYFFCGEESELTVKDAAYPLMYGHNLALNVRGRLFDKKVAVFLQGKYNFTEDSGVIVPGMNWEAFPRFTLSLSFPIVFGSTAGGYSVHNSANGYRRASVVIAVILRGTL